MVDIPEINYSGHIPVYKQIAQWMRGKIKSGVWNVDQKIMPETELARVFQVSRGTIRSAIEVLCEERLLIRVQGKGTYVSANLMDQRLTTGFVTISEDLVEKGIKFETEVRQKKIISPPPEIKKALGLEDREKVFFLERIRLVHDCPLYFLRNYVVHKYCQGIIEVDFCEEQLFEVLENQFHLNLDWGRRYVTATAAGGEISKYLNIQDRDPVMYLNQQTFLRDHNSIEYSNVWIRGNCIRLVADLQRSSKNPYGGSKLDFKIPSF